MQKEQALALVGNLAETQASAYASGTFRPCVETRWLNSELVHAVSVEPLELDERALFMLLGKARVHGATLAISENKVIFE